MPIYSTLHRLFRLALYLCLLGFLTIHGAHGEALPTTVRIGLQTKQSAVRLSGTAAVRVETEGQEPLALPADQALAFACKDGTITLADPAGAPLLTTTGPVRVLPDPNVPSADVNLPAAIRLLGPTRHYDGKADRPYRSTMELLPRAEGITVVNVVPFESYLCGVVSSEMSPRYPGEALKAQAIAARTYAAKNLGRMGTQGFDLDDTAACQVYGGIFSEDPRTNTAVTDTAGMVLTYDGKLIDAVYSSTCGGYTESAELAWGKPVPYLQSVSDCDEAQGEPPAKPASEDAWNAFFKKWRGLYCLQPKFANPEAFRWVKLVTRKELEAGLPGLGTVQQVTVLKRGDSGRITAVRIDGSDGTRTVEKELAIRRALGGLRSSAFTLDIYRDDDGTPVVFAFWGGGWGHGLGMCQVGAVGRADAGWSCEKILAHYYRGTTLEKW